jgi:cyclophilin family peptidyl-prolyl cis-trans isomerase
MRIAIITTVVAALLGSGFWLASQQQALGQGVTAPVSEQLRAAAEPAAPAEEAATESTETTETEATTEAAEAATTEEANGFYVPDGYELTPYLSDVQVQQFEAPDWVLEEDVDYAAVIMTSSGTIVVELHQDLAPLTVNNFVFLARHRFYDGIIFHRVLEDFMAQTGDPTGTGRGGPGYTFEDEFMPELTHDSPGVLSMANSGPNTNGSQFFITFVPTPWLDGRHSVFGRVVEGLDVLDDLRRVDPQNFDAFLPLGNPLSEVFMQGIDLEGSATMTLEAYLTERLGTVPEVGQDFTLDGYQAMMGQNRQTGEAVVVFWQRPDVIERLYIVERTQ